MLNGSLIVLMSSVSLSLFEWASDNSSQERKNTPVTVDEATHATMTGPAIGRGQPKTKIKARTAVSGMGHMVTAHAAIQQGAVKAKGNHDTASPRACPMQSPMDAMGSTLPPSNPRPRLVASPTDFASAINTHWLRDSMAVVDDSSSSIPPANASSLASREFPTMPFRNDTGGRPCLANGQPTASRANSRPAKAVGPIMATADDDVESGGSSVVVVVVLLVVVVPLPDINTQKARRRSATALWSRCTAHPIAPLNTPRASAIPKCHTATESDESSLVFFLLFHQKEELSNNAAMSQPLQSEAEMTATTCSDSSSSMESGGNGVFWCCKS